MSGLLKRKFEELEEDRCYSSSSPSSLSSSAYSGWDSDSESCYSDTLDSTPSNPSSPGSTSATSILKKTKRPRRGNVQFDQVTVFFFPRCQGFTSVPSRGGCSLGMVHRHSAQRRYTLSEFAVEQQQVRLEKLKDRMKEEKLEALRQKLTRNGTQESEEANQLTVDDILEDELDLSGVNLDGASFLHPYPSKRRHAILKAAGVKKIDKEEKRQLHELRTSREDCGCDCQGFCEPETCGCSLAGIKCQMDHSSFPCGCTKDGCGNTQGRIEFNPSRVQTHYIHTIMKLELEKRLEEQAADAEAGPKDRPATPSPGFNFDSALAPAGDNSCSSDMTDSSSSSGQSDAPCDTDGGRASPGVDETGLAELLSFSDTDGEEPGGHDTDPCPPGYGLFSPVERRQDSRRDDGAPVPDTPSPSVDRAASYMDLSLSSESDLEFFDGFPCLGPSSLYGSLKEYEHLENFFHFQLPSFPQANDPGTGILESLIGLTESVPEPPPTFTDNQMLEEAIKLSVMEYVKV